MSAESKKKRGEGGVANAKVRPFRLSGGGPHPDHYAGVVRFAGLSERIGRAQPGSAWDKAPAGLSYAEATAAEERWRLRVAA